MLHFFTCCNPGKININMQRISSYPLYHSPLHHHCCPLYGCAVLHKRSGSPSPSSSIKSILRLSNTSLLLRSGTTSITSGFASPSTSRQSSSIFPGSSSSSEYLYQLGLCVSLGHLTLVHVGPVESQGPSARIRSGPE